MERRQQLFPIHHPDISVGNIYVDAEYHIACIIDWAFCAAVPLSVLLTAPGLPQSRHELEPSLISAFENGYLAKATENLPKSNVDIELSHSPLMQCSRPTWLLSRFLDFNSIADFHFFEALTNLTYSQDPNPIQVYSSMQVLPQYVS